MLCCAYTAFPWASCIAVAAVLCTNVIEFVAGQHFQARSTKAAASATAEGHNCGHEHAPEVDLSLSISPHHIIMCLLRTNPEIADRRSDIGAASLLDKIFPESERLDGALPW